MRIVVAGSGYVGLVSGAGFAEIGNHVVCADIDSAKIERLRAGEIPIFEPGLESLIERNVAQGRLTFTDDLESAVEDTQAVFIAVGTPMRQDGAANLMAVDAVAETVAAHAGRECVLVAKSTVPVGTNARIRRLIEGAKVRVHAVSNPEFLKEGAAVGDFMRPDRIVVGVDEDDTFARDLMKRLYHPLCLDRDRMVWMDPASAELTKYVANTMLAMRISFMNEIAALCEQVGADIHKVRYGVGSDARIGPKFLYAGPGYGGSCLDGRETVLVERDESLALRRLDALFEAEADHLVDEPRTQVVEPRGLRVLAWTSDGSELREVQALTRRPYEGDVLEVRTKMGRRLRCTPDHPFVARRGPNGPEEVVLAEQLTEEHWLPAAVDRIPHEARAVESLDLLEVLERTDVAPEEVICRLDDADWAQLSALGSSAVADRIAPLGHPRGRDRAYDIVRTGACRVPEAQALGLRLEHAMLGTARNGTYVPRRLRLDERFWEVAGLYLAEGHITADGRRRRVFWSFHPRDEGELVDTVSRYWRDLGVKHDVREGTTAMHVSLSSRLLAAVWTDVLGLGADCYSHGFPEVAWSQPLENKRADRKSVV
jgi:UDPglucose 6-dehydrogenase